MLIYFSIAVALFAGAVAVAPHVLPWPVMVSLNGMSVQIPRGTTVERAAMNNMSHTQLRGDLLAVDGTMLSEGGGGHPTFTIRGQEVDPNTPLRRSQSIVVTRGVDQQEASIEQEFEIEPEQNSRGRGSMKTVTDSGQVGTSLRTLGKESEIELKVEVLTEPQTVEVQLSSYQGADQLIALTFDDGPHPEHTPALLDVLAREGVSATFFVTGLEVTRFPDIARRIVEEGHQIANHSYTHRDYRDMSYVDKRIDFQRAQDAIEEATGVRPNWARPPYGLMNASTLSLFGKEDIRVVLWTIDPLDFRRPGAGAIRNHVVDRARPGSIVLLHDGGGNREQTIRATRNIIRDLREEGFEFLTVEQLYRRAND